MSKAWTDLVAEKRDITLLAYTALQVEVRRPGTVPQELLAALSSKIEGEVLSAKILPKLENESIEYIEEVEALLQQKTDLGKIVANQRVTEMIVSGNINPHILEATREKIERDIHAFETLLEHPYEKEGVAA